MLREITAMILGGLIVIGFVMIQPASGSEQAYNSTRWMAELDSIIQANHEEFTKQHRMEIKSLICAARTDSILGDNPASVNVRMLCKLIAINQRVMLKAVLQDDWELARRCAKKIEYLQGEWDELLTPAPAGQEG